MNHTRRRKRRFRRKKDFPHLGFLLINEFGELENSLDMRDRFIKELALRQYVYGQRNGRKK